MSNRLPFLSSILLSAVLLGAPVRATAATPTLQDLILLTQIAAQLGIPPETLIAAVSDGITPEDIAILPPTLQAQFVAYLASGGALPTDIAGLMALLANLPQPTETFFANGAWQFGTALAVDLDGDGFLDAIEGAAGTSSLDAAATPFSGVPAGPPQPLILSKLQIKLNFAKPNSDALSLSGALPAPDGFAPIGQQVIIYVSGVAKAFTLDEKGKSLPSGKDSVKLSKPKLGAAKFSAKLSGGAFAKTLEDEGLANADAKNEIKQVPVTVVFNQALYQGAQAQVYSAKAGKSGRTKFPRP